MSRSRSVAAGALLALGLVSLGCQRFGYDVVEGGKDAGRDARAVADAGKLSPDASKAAPDAGACTAVADASKCDDSSACTTDEAALDPRSCETTCSHTTITRPAHGDGCCPSGSDANTDSDCASMCGNGVIEPGEACDGDARCAADCTKLLPNSLVHRYSFEGTGASAIDSVGGKDGTIQGSPLTGTGEVDLDGDLMEYVELPAGIVSALTNATFEAWVVWRGGTVFTASPYDSHKWERIFDFGSRSSDQLEKDKVGTSYLFLTPLQESTLPHVGFRPAIGSAEVWADGVAEFPLSTPPYQDAPTHVAVVLDDGAGLISLYIAGAYVSSVESTGHLATVNDVNNWLGRSQFGVDRYFDGTIQEFRIYDTALSAQQIAASYASGPDP